MHSSESIHPAKWSESSEERHGCFLDNSHIEWCFRVHLCFVFYSGWVEFNKLSFFFRWQIIFVICNWWLHYLYIFIILVKWEMCNSHFYLSYSICMYVCVCACTTKAGPTSRLPQPENESCLFRLFDKLIKCPPSPEHTVNWWLCMLNLPISCLLTCR